MYTCYSQIENEKLIRLIPTIRKIYESLDSYNPFNQTQYGSCVYLKDVLKDFPEMISLQEEFPSDGICRFMYTDRCNRNPHIDYVNGKLLPPVVVFPVVGCDETCINQWYVLESGIVQKDDYNIYLKKNEPFQLNCIGEYVLKDKPAIFNTSIWHALVNLKKQYRVIMRWYC